MRIVQMTLGVMLSLGAFQAMADGGREPARTQTCRLITGYGTAIGHGSTLREAEANAREICGNKMIDQYVGQRGSIPDSAVDELTTACINLSCQ